MLESLSPDLFARGFTDLTETPSIIVNLFLFKRKILVHDRLEGLHVS